MKRILAILLAILMVLSLAACGTTDEGKETESETKATEKQTEIESEKATTDSNEDKKDEEKEDANKLPETEDEILKYIMDALDASIAYKNDLSVVGKLDRSVNMVMGEENRNESAVNTVLIMFDSTNKLSYTENISEGSENNYTSTTKTFIDNGKLYQAQKEISEDSTDAEIIISKIHDSSVEEYTSIEGLEIFTSISEIFEGIKLADNMKEVKDSFTSVLPILFNHLYEEEYELVPPTLTQDVSVKIADGVCTLTISAKTSATATMEEIIESTVGMDIYHELSAKDGKIIAYKTIIGVTQKSVENGTVMQDYTQNVAMEMSLDYTFDKEKYDAFAVTLPEDLSALPVVGGPAESFDDVTCTVYVNGIESHMTSFSSDSSAKETLRYLIYDFDLDKATVQIFKDEAMTQELTVDNVTDADILALETVYIKVVPNAEYALITVKYSERDEFSKPYKIVMPTMEFFSAATSEWVELCEIVDPSEYTLDTYYVTGENCEILINGVKQDPKTESITLEAGKSYVIEYIEILSEKMYATDAE